MTDTIILLDHIHRYPTERYIERYVEEGDPRAFFEIGEHKVEYDSTEVSTFGINVAREHKLWSPKRNRKHDLKKLKPAPRCYCIIHYVHKKFCITNMIPKEELEELLTRKGHEILKFGPPNTLDAKTRTSFTCSVDLKPILQDVRQVVKSITDESVRRGLNRR